MDIVKLRRHVSLCLRNLKAQRTWCCAHCPFEDEIVSVFPKMKELFIAKREEMRRKK